MTLYNSQNSKLEVHHHRYYYCFQQQQKVVINLAYMFTIFSKRFATKCIKNWERGRVVFQVRFFLLLYMFDLLGLFRLFFHWPILERFFFVKFWDLMGFRRGGGGRKWDDNDNNKRARLKIRIKKLSNHIISISLARSLLSATTMTNKSSNKWK